MRSNYKRLGPHIQEVNVRNSDLSVDRLLGVSIKKILIPSIANTVGTDMSKYKVVRKGQFAYGPVTSRNGDKISIALLEDYDSAIISQSYKVFEIIEKRELLPEYLMMWFRRPEFDRYARFMSHGSTRETFDWEEMCDTELPIPSIEKQQEIVNEYNTITNRIALNEQLNQKLEETAQALYKHWFVDFEFPITKESCPELVSGFPELVGKPYKSSGGKMVYNEELEKEIPEGWELGKIHQIVKYSKNRINVAELSITNYVSTDNMNPNRAGIETASKLPSANTVTKFNRGNILISNIRPYFKKIWIAEFEGGCSNDVLCFENIEGIETMFTYYILEADAFFEYVMQGAKGTKMPRGDKDWIMNYDLTIPNKVAEKLLDVSYERNKENIRLLTCSELLLAKMTKVEVEEEIIN